MLCLGSLVLNTDLSRSLCGCSDHSRCHTVRIAIHHTVSFIKKIINRIAIVVTNIIASFCNSSCCWLSGYGGSCCCKRCCWYTISVAVKQALYFRWLVCVKLTTSITETVVRVILEDRTSAAKCAILQKLTLPLTNSSRMQCCRRHRCRNTTRITNQLTMKLRYKVSFTAAVTITIALTDTNGIWCRCGGRRWSDHCCDNGCCRKSKTILLRDPRSVY